MAKKVYEVMGTCTITVYKRVKAHNEDKAMELAEELFGGITSYCGNGDIDKLVGVENDSESIEADGYVEWKEANETDDDRYDQETDGEECTYRCNICGEEFYCEDDTDFDENVEEELWGHLQMEHEEEFEECQDWETPDMIEEYFEIEEA